MMSTLSDVFEQSSQERSRERSSVETRDDEHNSEDWQSARGRRSAETQESSSSDHGYELREVRFVQPPADLQDALEASRSGDNFPSSPSSVPASLPAPAPAGFTSPFQRHALFGDYRTRMERPPRGPAAASSREAHVTFTQQPNDSLELPRSTPLRSALRPSTEMSMTSAASIPADADPSSFVVQAALNKAAEENTERKSFQSLRLGSLGQRLAGATRNSSIPQRVRISLGEADGNRSSAVDSVTATLVRKRRRLPWKLLLAFGIVSCVCLMVALCTLSIGIYNFTKLRAARAARTVDALRNEIEPQIAEILRILQATRRFLR